MRHGKIQIAHMLMTILWLSWGTDCWYMELFAANAICQRTLQCLLFSCIFLCLIKFMDYDESGLMYLPKEEQQKNSVELAQQLELVWWHELLSNQLLSIACSTSFLPHTLIKIFWPRFFATEWTTTGNSKCLKTQHPGDKTWVLRSDLRVRSPELSNKVQIKAGSFKGTDTAANAFLVSFPSHVLISLAETGW